jgi:hypothetical protein
MKNKKVLAISCPCCGKKNLDILFVSNDTEYVASWQDGNIVQIFCYACNIDLLAIPFKSLKRACTPEEYTKLCEHSLKSMPDRVFNIIKDTVAKYIAILENM